MLVNQLTSQWYYKIFEVFFLSMLFVSLLISDSSFQLCFHQESRNRHIQHSDNTDFSPESFFSLSISHFCLLLSSVHCFSQCTPDETNKQQQQKITSKQNLPQFFRTCWQFFLASAVEQRVMSATAHFAQKFV